MCDCLVFNEYTLTVIDNFSTGQLSHLVLHVSSNKFTVIVGSDLDMHKLNTLIKESAYALYLTPVVGVFDTVNKPLDSLMTNVP